MLPLFHIVSCLVFRNDTTDVMLDHDDLRVQSKTHVPMANLAGHKV